MKVFATLFVLSASCGLINCQLVDSGAVVGEPTTSTTTSASASPSPAPIITPTGACDPAFINGLWRDVDFGVDKPGTTLQFTATDASLTGTRTLATGETDTFTGACVSSNTWRVTVPKEDGVFNLKASSSGVTGRTMRSTVSPIKTSFSWSVSQRA